MENKDDLLMKIFCLVFGCFAVIFGTLWDHAVIKNMELEQELEDRGFLVEGTVIAISDDGGTIYCISENTPDGYAVEVDVFDEVLCNCYEQSGYTCSLQVGDTVLYGVDGAWQDAGHYLPKYNDDKRSNGLCSVLGFACYTVLDNRFCGNVRHP